MGVVYGSAVGGVGAGVGLGVGLPIGQVLGSALFSTLFPLGAFALTYLVGREIYRNIARGRRRAMDGMMAVLVEEIRDCIQGAEGSQEPPTLPPSS